MRPCCSPREGCGLHRLNAGGFFSFFSRCSPREGCGLHQQNHTTRAKHFIRVLLFLDKV